MYNSDTLAISEFHLPRFIYKCPFSNPYMVPHRELGLSIQVLYQCFIHHTDINRTYITHHWYQHKTQKEISNRNFPIGWVYNAVQLPLCLADYLCSLPGSVTWFKAIFAVHTMISQHAMVPHPFICLLSSTSQATLLTLPPPITS